jgi:alpha-tubulin suppressor-like RCC1 family protein
MALSQLSFFGRNDLGQCLLADAGTAITVPTVAPLDWLPDGKRVLQVSIAYQLTLLLADDDSQLYAVGHNEYGQLGRGHSNNDDPDNRVPRPVTGIGLERITHIAAGFCHCAAVTGGGKLLLWGRNQHGQCGTGTAGGNVLAVTRCNSGALADADARVVFVACGGFHTVALTSDAGVIAFGYNHHGQLGTGNADRQPTPERLACAALDGVRIVGCAAGYGITQFVSDDGRVFAMGKNDNGQLGTGNTTDVNTPTEIDAAHFGGAPIAAVSCGFSHTMAITRDEGKLYCWGQGEDCRTGLGHTDDATTPQPVVGALAGARVVRIVAGLVRSCALAGDGRVFAFGRAPGIQEGVRTPQLLQEGALAAGTAVCAIGTGCSTEHTVFVGGPPPNEPGFDSTTETRARLQLFSAWVRRRTLLMCLLHATQRSRAGGVDAKHALTPLSSGSSGSATAAAFAGDDEMLLRVAELPEELWQGSLIFRFI